jgi:hypothetical protein
MTTSIYQIWNKLSPDEASGTFLWKAHTSLNKVFLWLKERPGLLFPTIIASTILTTAMVSCHDLNILVQTTLHVFQCDVRYPPVMNHEGICSRKYFDFLISGTMKHRWPGLALPTDYFFLWQSETGVYQGKLRWIFELSDIFKFSMAVMQRGDEHSFTVQSIPIWDWQLMKVEGREWNLIGIFLFLDWNFKKIRLPLFN